MARKSYNTKRRKREKIQYEIFEVRDGIKRQKLRNEAINRALVLRQPKRHHINRLLNYTTDWVDLKQIVILENTDDAYFDVDSQYYEWVIELKEFDLRILPFIDIKVVYRESDFAGQEEIIVESIDDDDKEILGRFDKTVINYEIADSSRSFSDVKIIVGYYVNIQNQLRYTHEDNREVTWEIPYQARLEVNILNPRDYV